MIHGIEHIGLCANNPEGLTEWYADVLGYTVIYAIRDRMTFFLQDRNGGILEVYPSAEHSPVVDNVHSGVRHIGITVSGIDEEIDTLKKNGIEIPERMIVRTPEMKLAFFKDPEGNILHFVERVSPLPSPTRV
jgi:glyoxylase I family protein